MQLPEEHAVLLLYALEQRLQEYPALVSEWESAWEDFSGGRQDPMTADRFREWFLLERESVSLGSAPVVAWAPDHIASGSAWEALLDSFLGIYRVSGVTEEQAVELEDLWTGRTLVTRDLQPDDLQDEETLVVGRFVLSDTSLHTPLPGVFILAIPGMAEALEQDFARIRAEQPRQRLSQLELERLLQTSIQMGEPLEDARARTAIEELLAQDPSWTLERLEQSVQTIGLNETMDQLAFDSQLDLEQLRRWLPSYFAAKAHAFDAESSFQAEAAAEIADSHRGSDAAEIDRAAAVARFESGRDQGRPLEALFDQLERDLGLEPGSSREFDTEFASAEERGTQPDLKSWLAAYMWEAEATGETVTAEERAGLERFIGFLETSFPRLEITALHVAHVFSFLVSLGSVSDGEQIQENLLPFLRWAAQEQNAPLDEYLQNLPLKSKHIVAILKCNESLRQRGVHPGQRALIVQTEPLAVKAADGELALVSGMPSEFQTLARNGDWLMGSWKAGRFEVAALLPAEAMPVQPD